jgi:hypothetical protein
VVFAQHYYTSGGKTSRKEKISHAKPQRRKEEPFFFLRKGKLGDLCGFARDS